MTLEEWAGLWQEARDDKSYNCKRVLDVWRIDPADYCRTPEYWWNLAFGYRKQSSSDAGEKEFERALLENEGLAYLINAGNDKSVKLKIKLQNVALANQKKGQTITDCLGVLYDNRGRKHPVAIEVKKRANDPWYAVVENLQQVRLMRSSVKELKKYFKGKVSIDNVKGACGMILAPEEYYTKNKGRAEGSYRAACRLCNYMKEKGRTEARITIASINWGKIVYKAGHWPG
jgi:hypothetical protein